MTMTIIINLSISSTSLCIESDHRDLNKWLCIYLNISLQNRSAKHSPCFGTLCQNICLKVKVKLVTTTSTPTSITWRTFSQSEKVPFCTTFLPCKNKQGTSTHKILTAPANHEVKKGQHITMHTVNIFWVISISLNQILCCDHWLESSQWNNSNQRPNHRHDRYKITKFTDWASLDSYMKIKDTWIFLEVKQCFIN